MEPIRNSHHLNTMQLLKNTLVLTVLLSLTGCAAVPFGIGLIPGAPSYFSSIIGNGQSAYETAMDERSTEQQMRDAIIAGHAQAELYKHKEIRPSQISAYCYFDKLYLVGEYDSQEQLKKIYECMKKVDNKRAVISRLYLKESNHKNFLERQAMYAEIEAQLMADFEVTSSPIDVKIVQEDIILMGVISDKKERDRIMAHALSTSGVNRVISYLYHSEIAGPKPRTMSAELAPQFLTASKKRKKPVRPKAPKQKKSKIVVLNPDCGR